MRVAWSVLKAEASCPTKAFEYYYYQQIVWSRSRTEYESFDFDNSLVDRTFQGTIGPESKRIGCDVPSKWVCYEGQ